MRLGLWIVNGILAALIVFGAISVATESNTLLDAIPTGLGASLWLFVPWLTLKGARPGSSGRIRKASYILNGLVIASFVLAGAFAVARTGVLGVGQLIGLCLAAGFFVFNIIAVRKLSRPAPLTLELVPDDAAVPTTPQTPASSISPFLPAGQLTAQAGSSVRKANYLVRHWRGDLPLGISYWVNGSLLGVGLTLLFAVAATLLDDVTTRTSAFVSLSLILLALAVSVWSVVGIWRSSEKHAARGGRPGWAATARVVTVLSVLSASGTFVNNVLPQIKELSLIASGNDPIGKIDVKIAADGRSLIVRGMLRTDSANHVRKVLDAAPGVRTVMLDSLGGRLKEAKDIADLVRGRELNTYVEGACESACTYIFLAGRDRAATPNARIGFHAPSFPGMDRDMQTQMMATVAAVYRDAGLSRSFIDRVSATPPDEMWYPEREELIENGVINRISLGGEQASLATARISSKAEIALAFRGIPHLVALDRHLPGTIDKATEAAWRARVDGAPDEVVLSAARQPMLEAYPLVLAAANDAQLESFLNLSIDQYRAALAVSDGACSKLLAAKLDVSKVLPPALAKRETDWLADVLAGPLVPRPLEASKNVERALGRAMQDMPVAQLDIIGDFEAYSDQPRAQCETMIELYRRVLALPSAVRSTALHGMFQEEPE